MSFSDPFQPNLPNYLDNIVTGMELSYPSAFSAHGRTPLYDPDPGKPIFPESNYQPYEWESLIHATPPIRTSLPIEPEYDVQSPDYRSTVEAFELARQELTRRSLDGLLDPEESQLLRYLGNMPVTEDSRQQDTETFQNTPQNLTIRPSAQAAQVIEAAIDYAKLPAKPMFPPFLTPPNNDVRGNQPSI